MARPTTYQTAGQATPVGDPFANKAIAAGLTTIAGVATQWIATGAFSLSQEGATAIVGGVATFLVWAVSNWKRRGL
jgi:hypothetical protein